MDWVTKQPFTYVCVCVDDIDIDGLVQERRNSSAFAMELRPFCINPSIWRVGISKLQKRVLQIVIESKDNEPIKHPCKYLYLFEWGHMFVFLCMEFGKHVRLLIINCQKITCIFTWTIPTVSSKDLPPK